MVIKVCGLTRAEDVDVAVRHGATAIGFVFWPQSPRAVTPDQAAALVARIPAGVERVGVFVNEGVAAIHAVVERAGLTCVQLHGDEPASYAAQLSQPHMRAMSAEEALDTDWPFSTTLLLDAADRARRGGTGQRVNWEAAARVARQRPVVLAGGLTPDNVEAAIEQVAPIGVDVSSGVEDAPGVKNADKVAAFLARARHALEAR
ncbi:MAG TPA: phosphoribosylanthranilate isomerase [Vicinamibacterales bacterium]